MRLRDKRSTEKPEVMIIPMIDIMFFLLVFFMIGTLYMVNVRTVPVNLPRAAHAQQQATAAYVVTMKGDGSLWLEDESITKDELIRRAREEQQRNPQFSVVLRADQNLNYGNVVALLDDMRASGITRFGLAAEGGANP